MDRFVRVFQLLVGLTLFGTAWAQPSPEATTPPPPHQEPAGPPELKERWKKLPPEERERFSKNLQKWEHLSDEEKKRLRERGRQVWEQGRQEIDQLASELGVKLSPLQREELIKAYLQKRREIERKIRAETEPRRKELIAEAVQELKKEFGTQPKAAASPSPSGSP